MATVIGELNNLDYTIDDLETLFMEMENRLSSVLAPATPMTNDTVVADTGVKVIDQILHLKRRLRHLSEIGDEMLGRLRIDDIVQTQKQELAAMPLAADQTTRRPNHG